MDLENKKPMPMKRRTRGVFLFVFFVIIYAVFVCLYNDHVQQRLLKEMERHALVLEDDIWTLNPYGSVNYLSLAAARDNYSKITIEDVPGAKLISVEGPELTGIDGLLEKLGFFPEQVLTAPIVHEGNAIGRLRVVHRNRNIYVFFYAGLILGLLFVAIVLFYKTVDAKREVEGTVLARTAELRQEIEERSRVAQALRQSEERFQYAMRATKDGLWDWDISNDSVYFSPGYYSILDYEDKEFPMAEQEWRNRVHPDDMEKTLEALQDCVDDRAEGFEAEFRMKTKHGDWKWILGRGRAVSRDENGRAVRLVGTHVDITGRKHAEQERRRLEAQLQRSEKMELVGTLAGGVAHDLNNILGAIVGYPDLLLEKLSRSDPMRSHLVAIRESGERAALIVQDLLTLARRGVATREPENLNRIIGRYLKSREFAKLKELHPNVEVEAELADNLPNILGSEVHLAKTIMNLCDNAAEAMPKGGKLKIFTANEYLDGPIKGYDHIEEGNYVALTVTDEGVGISKDDLKRIFEPFYSKKVMGRSGTGLGMAVVWGTVKDHKGYIDVESKEGVGATFKLYFPVTEDSVRDKNKAVLIEEILGNGEKILVVDDVGDQREIAINILKRLGYSVDAVSTGEEAVAYVKDNPVDLLVLDMIMEPGMDGLETYRQIVQIRPEQKAIISSGFSETDRVRKAQKLGAGQYIKKPYTLEQLGLVVKQELSPEGYAGRSQKG